MEGSKEVVVIVDCLGILFCWNRIEARAGVWMEGREGGEVMAI